MGERADKTVWVLALAAAALGAGAFGRYPIGFAQDGLAFGAIYAAGVGVLALPLLLGEAALGQFRRRNVVDAFGPSPWRFVGMGFALAALALGAYLAIVGGWAARYAYASFTGSYFDDPARYFRLASQGWDALLFALGAVVVAVGISAFGARRGLRGVMTLTATLALLAAAGLVAWSLTTTGGPGRSAALVFDPDVIDPQVVVLALRQALLPGLVGVGVIATLSMRVHDRTLPREGVVLSLAWILVPVLVGAGLAALAHDQGLALDGGVEALFTTVPALFAAIGGTTGGVLSGVFFGILVTGCLAGMIALLEVPATVLTQRATSWTERRALVAAGLVTYLVAVPLAFVANGAADLERALAAIVAPLGGLLVALHVGWVRPEVLDGFTIGDARHRLDTTLRPVLRFVLPVLLLALLVLGALQHLADWGAVDRGTAGLWKFVP